MSVLVKRYANRKLYNTKASRYITLKGIAELIEAGEDVTVIDNETGEDITSVALSQILVDSERTSRWVSRTVLSDLIQRGGDALYGALRRGVDDASEGIDEVRRNMRRLVHTRGEDGKLRDWIAFAPPDFEHMVQNAMERVLKLLDLPRRSDIEALNENLQRVADAVERLDARPEAAQRAASAPGARSEAKPSEVGHEGERSREDLPSAPREPASPEPTDED